MNRSKDIELFKLSIEKVLKKYGKWVLKMCGNPASLSSQLPLELSKLFESYLLQSLLLFNLTHANW